MSVKPLYIGIDLGTTNSTLAAFDGRDVTLVRNGHGSLLTPSVVRIDGKGSVLVGTKARRFLDLDPGNTKSEFKRLMGTAHRLQFPANGCARRPEELAAEVLKVLRRDAEDQLGVAPDCAVLAVPALFELPQTAATSEAARLAGFERIELIQEPVASAIATGWTQDDTKGAWLVYDLGGGTFDVSLLETQRGSLRVVGHDGDNFLGGRDFDRALVDLVLNKLRGEGVQIDRDNPQHAAALQRLRFAVEEAKIELTRARDTTICIPRLELSERCIDVELSLMRAEYEALIGPLVDRSLAICLRLLDSQGLGKEELQKVVLVGGPTLTPLLRERVQAVFGVPLGEGLDPMTLVAQGAALFAGTVGLDGRPVAKVAGSQQGRRVPLAPTQLSITHGLTLIEPPLSRSVGVALSDNRVRVYFERGSPLPIRRTFTLRTSEAVTPGSSGHALKVPIVQGEFAAANLCRLVGTLDIPSSALSVALPIGSEVELTMELDRGGQLRAMARLASIDTTFDRVALLVTPELSIEALEGSLVALRERASSLSRSLFQKHATKSAGRLSAALSSLEQATRNVAAARGGDLDAGEQARRQLTDFDALLAEIEAELAWPALEQRLETEYGSAIVWLAQFGNDAEQQALTRSYAASRAALAARHTDEVERQIQHMALLGTAAYFRHPDAWGNQFQDCAGRIADCSDIRRTVLVEKGSAALRQGDRAEVERIVRELWRLYPVDREEQALSHGSGVRSR